MIRLPIFQGDPEGDTVVEPIVIPPSPVISEDVITNVEESVHSPDYVVPNGASETVNKSSV